MTVEEKAEEYAKNSGIFYSEARENIKLDFIAGYTMRDGESQWVKCSERLPEPGEDVMLCVSFSQKYRFGFLQIPDRWYIYETGENHILSAVTHWMPLPQPPKND